MLAGVAGFGPTSEGVKVPCLTAWLYPYSVFSVSKTLFDRQVNIIGRSPHYCEAHHYGAAVTSFLYERKKLRHRANQFSAHIFYHKFMQMSRWILKVF